MTKKKKPTQQQPPGRCAYCGRKSSGPLRPAYVGDLWMVARYAHHRRRVFVEGRELAPACAIVGPRGGAAR